jgi:hypothetical protein
MWGFEQLAAHAHKVGYTKDTVCLIWAPSQPSLGDLGGCLSPRNQCSIVYGPHFSVFPDASLARVPCINNAVYAQPSTWAKTSWELTMRDELRAVPIVVAPFPVDISTFMPGAPRVGSKVLVYVKQRSEDDVCIVLKAITSCGGIPVVVRYGLYTEPEYISVLQQCVCGVWVGSHESQGFALQEALATNLPLLVWDMGCMVHSGRPALLPGGDECLAQSAPYFDNRCGMVVSSAKEVADTFPTFFALAQSGTVFTPRDFVLQHLDVEPVFTRYWLPLLPPRPALSST